MIDHYPWGACETTPFTAQLWMVRTRIPGGGSGRGALVQEVLVREGGGAESACRGVRPQSAESHRESNSSGR